MESLAHSARLARGIPAQRYAEHIGHVVNQAGNNARDMVRFFRGDGEAVVRAVSLAAELHDLGKLDPGNQIVLSETAREALPVNHVDAGVAETFALSKGDLLAASLIFAHHQGLPDFQDQRNSGEGYVLRDAEIKDLTDHRLETYVRAHRTDFPFVRAQHSPPLWGSPFLLRLALGCLVDADHQDTATHYRQYVPAEARSLCAIERLSCLDKYVAGLALQHQDERSPLRTRLYNTCRQTGGESPILACDSPVGSGKTTAVMAHLLNVASAKSMRRIFVVLPYVNIINQSVSVYRRALVLPGESEDDIVAAHHHRAEFSDIESRQLTFLWQSPVIVTTAVQFFETLASDRPESLRKLHQLPGSAVFIDESHAALPPHLWVQAWRWIKELSDNWGCHFVLGSGSLTRFWQLPDFCQPPESVPDLVTLEDSRLAREYETERVSYRTRSEVNNTEPIDLMSLVSWVSSLPGPRLLIVNTVQSAAVIAQEIGESSGRATVEHISTALSPRDREASLAKVRRRLSASQDNAWTLVATSCMEAGVDLSFATGIRERCSLSSLIQIGGRVNRNGDHPGAEVWDIEIKHEGMLRPHPDFEISGRILGELFSHSQIGPEWVTEAIKREVRQRSPDTETIKEAEASFRFPTVADKFKVISDTSVTAIVDDDLVSRLKARDRIQPSTLQMLSVQVHRRFLKQVGWLEELPNLPGVYVWKLKYDDFLGYMAGVLQTGRHLEWGSIV